MKPVHSTAAIWSPAVLATTQLARMHARCPAAWLGCVTAAMPFAWTGGGIPAERTWLVLPLVITCGGLAAAAALGDPPIGLPDGRRQPWLPVWAGRVVWPLGAAAMAAIVSSLSGQDPWSAVGIGGGVVASIVLTAAVAFGVRAAGVESVLAVSSGLLSAAAAATTALAVGALEYPVLWQAAAASLASAVVAWTLWRLSAWEQGVFALGAAAGEQASPLVAISMVTVLAAMVGCFFLAPNLAAGYPVVALSWFICLAVPAATASSQPHCGLWLSRSAIGPVPLPGSVMRAAAKGLFQAAVLGWPAVVAMLLPAVDGSRAVHPGIAVGCLALAAVLLLAVVSGATRWGFRGGETPRAIYLAGVAGTVIGAILAA